MPFTTFVIPSSSRGGSLKVDGVDRAAGFYLLMSPPATTKFKFIGFSDADSFKIELDDVVTNMRLNLKEIPSKPVSIQPTGISVTLVEHHRASVHPG
jgi:hypothetical protein